MAFSENESLWDEFLRVWPLQRLRTMSLPEYTTSGDSESFVYWLEFKLGDYGSFAGGSAFKFGIFSRKDTAEKQGDKSLAYGDQYAWYRRFGDTPESAFEMIRGHVVRVAEAASRGRFEDIDSSPLGAAYRWKIAFHYQPRAIPSILCIYLRKPLLHALQLSPGDRTTPQSALYRALAEQRRPGESIIAFSARVWKEWVRSTPYIVKLSEGAIKHGYLSITLASAPFPETMYGGDAEADKAEMAKFATDTSENFECDIRVLGDGSGRLRHSLAKFYVATGAKAGDTVTITQAQDGSYLISRDNGVAAAATSEDASSAPGSIANPTATRCVNAAPLNQILYGPPGTGKTYIAIEKALEIVDPHFLESLGDEGEGAERRIQLKRRYDELTEAGLIQFVTFHQSFSYEDFVEGIRAVTDDESGQTRYVIADGVFKRLCSVAGTRLVKKADAPSDFSKRRIWKLSLGNSATDQHIYDECISKGMALLGYGGGADFSGSASREAIREVLVKYGEDIGQDAYAVTALNTFVRQIKTGDLIVVTEGNLKFRAIGEVTGDYRLLPREDYAQCRDVRWLRVYRSALPFESLMDNRFSQMAVYELHPGSIDLGKLALLLKQEESPEHTPRPSVLIIDEINRGNVSRIFGELITLIEPSKRAGADEALKAVLPYSKETFSVPGSVHLIGTMNTADRSLSGLDVALRRRFAFVEMPAQAAKLEGIKVAGVELARMLEIMNRRIDVLLGKDHHIGHAYFMSLRNGDDLSGLAAVFRRQIMPLLQEYFFEDWQRIRWVLNDHRKKKPGCCFVVPLAHSADYLFGPAVEVPIDNKLWRLDDAAFDNVDSYLGIIDAGQDSSA